MGYTDTDNESVITDCAATGTVLGGSYAYAGGLVGDFYGTITDCLATGEVIGCNMAMVGGLVGNMNGTIQNSYATGTITGLDASNVGGLVGYLVGNSNITNCYATGNAECGDDYITDENDYVSCAGGLVGYGKNSSVLTNSYARGNVSGGTLASVGGLAGFLDGSIHNCYVTGSVEGGYDAWVGGFIGDIENCTISYGYWNTDAIQTLNDSEREANAKVGIGDNLDADTTTAETATYMQSTDFVTLLNTKVGDNFSWMADTKSVNDNFPILSGTGNASQPAPTGLSGVIPTSSANNDGKITGTTTTMEYKLSTADVGTYKACTAPATIGLAPGTYQVRYAAKEGFNAGAAATVTIPAYIPVTGLTLNQTTMTLLTGGGTGTLTATVTPDIATNKTVTWKTSDTKVATVNNGIVTPIAPGTTTITATTSDGNFSKDCIARLRCPPG